MRRRLGLLLAAALSACAATPQDHCVAQDEAAARQIAAGIVGTAADEALQVEDQGDHWRVGRHAETRLEGDMIVSEDRGFTFRIDKCTGAVSEFRSWP